MRHICRTWVPHFLTAEQLSSRVAIRKEWLEIIENDPNIFKRVVMCDESWMHHFEPTLKQQCATWKTTTSPRKKKAWKAQSTEKVTLIAFFDYCEMLYQQCVPPKWR